MKKAILIIEDDPLVRDIIDEFLAYLIDDDLIKRIGTDCVRDAKEVIEHEQVMLVITDVNLGHGPDGLSFAKELAGQKNRPYIIVISSLPDMEEPRRLLKIGWIDNILYKPFSLHEFEKILKQSEIIDFKITAKEGI